MSKASPAGFVETHSHEGSRRRSFLAVAVDAEASAADAVSTIEQETGDLVRVTVEGKSELGVTRHAAEYSIDSPVVVDDDGHAGREERVEPGCVECVRVIGSEDEKVNNVDDPHAQVTAKVFLELSGGADDLGLKFESDTDEDDVWFDSVIDRVRLPDRDSGRAVSVGFLDRKEDGSRRLRADDEVDVVLRAEAVLDDRNRRVRIGGEVDTSEVGREREDGSDESRLLDKTMSRGIVAHVVDRR